MRSRSSAVTRSESQYSATFEEVSGFNNSLAAKDGQPVNASDLSQIAESTGKGAGREESRVGTESLNQRHTSELIDLPKIALMFLTRGSLPHESTWRLFLESIPRRGNHK